MQNLNEEIRYGSHAAEREKQIVTWATQNRHDSFTEITICRHLFGEKHPKGGIPKLLLESYRVGCRDLQRKEILKRIGLNEFILNDKFEQKDGGE